MLKDRAIQVDLVKKDGKDKTPGQKDILFDEKLVMVSVSAERIVKRIGIVVCVYVVLDTARKVVIELAKAKQLEA